MKTSAKYSGLAVGP